MQFLQTLLVLVFCDSETEDGGGEFPGENLYLTLTI